MQTDTQRYWKMRIWLSLFIGYALYYFTRKCFVYSMPGLIEELGYDKAQLGIMGTLFALTYGASKFFSGILSDKTNPRYLMAIGLFVTGVVTILFGFSSSILVFSILWSLNGWFQGFGWPPCVKYLTQWYPKSERGSWWSSWTVSQNVGSFLIPWIVGAALFLFGWRVGMMIPGIIAIGGSFFLLYRLPSSRESVGLLPLEEESNEKGQKGPSLVKEVLKNRGIWLLAAAYFFVYIVRTGFGDWIALFLIEHEGYDPLTANGFASSFEAGGFFGSLSAGWISDRLFQARRGPVNFLFAIALLAVLPLFWFFPLVRPVSLFLIGFAIFGPQVLIGVAAAEMVDKKAAATATGLIGWIAYIGSALAGYPLGKIIDSWGWQGFFIVLSLSAVATLVFLIPSLRSRETAPQHA